MPEADLGLRGSPECLEGLAAQGRPSEPSPPETFGYSLTTPQLKLKVCGWLKMKQAVKRYITSRREMFLHKTCPEMFCLQEKAWCTGGGTRGWWVPCLTCNQLHSYVCSLQAFLTSLLEEVHAELLLKGNISASEARALTDVISKVICKRRLPISERPQQQIARIPRGQSFLLRQAYQQANECPCRCLCKRSSTPRISLPSRDAIVSSEGSLNYDVQLYRKLQGSSFG